MFFEYLCRGQVTYWSLFRCCNAIISIPWFWDLFVWITDKCECSSKVPETDRQLRSPDGAGKCAYSFLEAKKNLDVFFVLLEATTQVPALLHHQSHISVVTQIKSAPAFMKLLVLYICTQNRNQPTKKQNSKESSLANLHSPIWC